jgi:Fe-S-cluster-containing hydrogenase component 2
MLKRKILVLNPKLCTGCEACVYTCIGIKGRGPSRVRVDSNEAEGCFRPILCVGCIDRPCLFCCPFGAIRFSRRLNLPLINEKKCIGCDKCSKICPFETIIIDVERKKAIKCDVCRGKPACAEACIPGAISYVLLTKETALQKHFLLIQKKG